VKKFIGNLALAAVVVGTLIYARNGRAQDGGAPAAAQPAGPHQIGLIDMAHVFKEYEKFKTLSEDLRAQVQESDAEAQTMVQALQQTQAQMSSGTYAAGSPEYQQLEQQLIEQQTEIENFRKRKQLEFLRKEADIYKTVYLEVQDAVGMYARHYKYTLIMRFNRAKVEDAENPQEIIQSMNRPVVFYKSQDDLTDPILNYLNQQYTRTTGGAAGQ
jgi:outer membrane protein